MRIRKMNFLGYCPKCGKDVLSDFCDECQSFTQEPEEGNIKCRSTRTNVREDISGTKYGKLKGRKPRKNRVRFVDKGDEKSSRRR